MLKKNKTKNYKFFILSLLAIAVLIFLGVFLRSFWFKTMQVPEKTFFDQGWNLKSYLWGLTHLKELVQENQRLNIENTNLFQKIQEISSLQEENLRLKESLKIPTETDFSFALLQPIIFDQTNNYLYLSPPKDIDLIKQNTPILTYTKQPVGIVEKVFSGYIVVKLITAPDFKLIAQTEKTEEVILKGEGNFNLTLENFPKDKFIEKEEKILTSPSSRFFPPNLLIGKVAEVKSSDIDPFQKVKISPYFTSSKFMPFLALLNWRYPK